MKLVDDIYKYQFEPYGFMPHNLTTNNAIGMWVEEQKHLLWLALQSNNINMLEIGSFCGGSTVLLCLAKKNNYDIMKGSNLGKVFACDLDFSAWNNAFNRNLYRIGHFDDICVKLEMSSSQLGSVSDQFSPLSFAFIDGFHSFRSVMLEFYIIHSVLETGGIIAFHDCMPQPYNVFELDRLYDDATKNFKEWMARPIPIVNNKNPQAYFDAEKQQDFLIDEAVAYILHEYDYELIEPPSEYCNFNYEHITGPYQRGRTSPFNGLVAIRKK